LYFKEISFKAYVSQIEFSKNKFKWFCTKQCFLGFPNTLSCYLNFTFSKDLFSNKFEHQNLMETKSKKGLKKGQWHNWANPGQTAQVSPADRSPQHPTSFPLFSFLFFFALPLTGGTHLPPVRAVFNV
jgi:hypothetical protein